MKIARHVLIAASLVALAGCGAPTSHSFVDEVNTPDLFVTPTTSEPTVEPTTKPSATGNVPDVTDYDEEEAISILEEAGFQVEVDYVDADYEEDGVVLDQDPMGGDDAERGSTIYLEVGSFE